jgi:hypothetical protein
MLNGLIMDLNGTLGSPSNSSPMPQSSYRNGKRKRELKRALIPLLMPQNNHILLDISNLYNTLDFRQWFIFPF